MPPQLWGITWGGCGAGPGLFSREGGMAWSRGEAVAEGTPWSLVGLSSVISSGQRYTSMGPLVLFRWSWRLSWGGQSKAQGGIQKSTHIPHRCP